MIDSCEADALILIPIFIHDFLCVHLFNAGNSRMSRLFTTLLLYQQGYVVGIYISIESQIEKIKMKCDFESCINLVDDKLPAIEQVRAAIKEKIGKFTKSEIMEFMPGIGKASAENIE